MNYFHELTLNGQAYFRNELVKLVTKKLAEKEISDFKKSLYKFIQEWISDEETITVKTSGTTGIPKEITFRKEQFVHSALMTCEYFNLNRKSKGLLCLSPDYIAGKMMIVRAFVCGMDLITLEPSNHPLLSTVEKVDFAAFVPLQVQNLFDNEISRKRFETIKNVIIGGAVVSPYLEKELERCTNAVYVTFAMTETLSHVALRKLSGKDRSDKYLALPGAHFEKDARDCLVIHAPLVSDAPVITNDVIELYDPIHFKWVGRFDDVINSGGIKLHPAEIEKKLAGILADNRYFITSIPDEKLGQKVVLVVEGITQVGIAKFKTKIKSVLEKYEVPKEYFIIEKFLETASGKVRKSDTIKLATIL